jgi:SAM-dependent methyltransferase
MKAPIRSPFDASATWVETIPTAFIRHLYQQKCGLDVTRHLKGVDSVDVWSCDRTGYRFYTPVALAGDESFYQELSAIWPDYYQAKRWDFGHAARFVGSGDDVLEIGCGVGHFLKSVEGRCRSAIGLEFNTDAIRDKVTAFDVKAEPVEIHAATGARYDVVASFQVLEHVTDPAAFLKAAVDCLRPGGRLLISTPNHEYVPHIRKDDAFDLPPHHTGLFTPDTYRALAEVYGLTIERIIREPRDPRVEEVSAPTRPKLLYKIAKAISIVSLTLAYRLTGEPGSKVLVVFRKP